MGIESFVREFVWDFVLDKLYNTCSLLVHKNEVKFLPIKDDDEKSYSPLFIYLFVVDRYLSNKINPIKYRVVESSKYSEKGLTDIHIKSLRNIKKLLEKGDSSINSYSRSFIPGSIKAYFKNNGKALNKDFSGAIFGIKHLHLNPSKHSDTLLFYVIVKSVVYFIKVGNHQDYFKKDLLEILVNEFPEILPKLGVYSMPDMPFSNHEYSPKEVESVWKSGGSISFGINNEYYMSTNSQNTSTLSIHYNYLVSNLSFQIEQQIKPFVEELTKVKNIKDIDLSIDDSILDELCILELKNKIKVKLDLEVLKLDNYALRIKSLNLEK